MDEPRESVQVRMSADTLAEVDAYASRVGVSRNAAICVLTDMGLGRHTQHQALRRASAARTKEQTVAARIVTVLSSRATTGNPWLSSGKLRKGLASYQRDMFLGVIEGLLVSGDVACRTDGANVWYALPGSK